MNFTVAVDVLAYFDVNDLMSRNPNQRAAMLSAFREIVRELQIDADKKGKPYGTHGLRTFDIAPLRAIYSINGRTARIKAFRRLRP